jgi:hypothetical protein
MITGILLPASTEGSNARFIEVSYAFRSIP